MSDELCGEEAVAGPFPVVARLAAQMTAREKQFVLRFLEFVVVAHEGFTRQTLEEMKVLFAEHGHRPMTVREREMLLAYYGAFGEALKAMAEVVRG